MRRFLATNLTGLLGATLLASGAQAVALYAVSGEHASVPNPEALFLLDQTDASSSFVKQFGDGDDGEAIAYHVGNGLLYHASGFGAQNDPVAGEILETYDVSTGTLTNVPLSGADYDEARGFGYDPGSGLLLLADRGNVLHSVTGGGFASVIGAMDHQSKGLAFLGSDLYSIENDNPNLHVIDPADGSTLSSVALTLAGETVNGATGLAVHPETGELWALLKLDFQSGRELVTIDPVTGVATSIGDTGVRFAGIAFAPIPEPSTGLLLGLGLLALARRRSPHAPR